MQTNEATFMDLALDWDDAFYTDVSCEGFGGIGVSDALILSLTTLGSVDIKFIMEKTGEDFLTVTSALSGVIFQNPERWAGDIYRGWETAEEYLSGNMRHKLKAALEANATYKGLFMKNVEAIRSVLPESVGAEEIYVTLGSPWVPADIIQDFIRYIFKIRERDAKWIRVRHDEYTGTWEIINKSLFNSVYDVAAKSTFGTPKAPALTILEKTLNMKSVTVYDEIYSRSTKKGTKRVVNQTETILAIEKQTSMIEAFQRWIWRDQGRRNRLEAIYEEKYGCIRKRHFDGSFLTFPGLSKSIELHPYQKNAVARILFSPNTLLAHDVGSGKTYVMIAAGMELSRMGLSKKNMYVVPNNLVSQWGDIFHDMYPEAKVFCVEPKIFTPEQRYDTLKTVRDGDWDAVIIAYSCFERINLSKDIILAELTESRDKLSEIENEVSKSTAGLNRKIEQLNKMICTLSETYANIDETVFFDELGVTRLFVDEAHNYKNVPIETGIDRVLGISPCGSQKCKDMMDKVHYIQKQNNGGGVVMATGTPITNSLTDAYVMQKYLQSGELAMLDIHNFDAWVGMFAERVTDFEVDVDTNSYRLATRFSKFHNLPELTALLSSIADFHQADDSVDIPDFDGYTDTLIEKTPRFSEYLQSIAERADRVRQHAISRKEDNMLKITTDGRKAALDIRLVDESEPFTFMSKVARCAINVYDVYKRTSAQKGTQLVFCDYSTPKEGFNVYDDLKRALVEEGIPAEQIAFVHDATTESKRAKLFEKVRGGEIRVLLGSTFKLGTGVNVQDKLVAIHHLDVPWRPSDMTQREGRILRQGNENDKVYIYRYITKGSFDAYSWQLLESKQRFISELLEGSITSRDESDIDNTVLSYAEVKALAIGNPLVKKRVEIANELTRITSLNRRDIENRAKLEKELREIPEKISHHKNLVELCRQDIADYNKNYCELGAEERRRIREALAREICRSFNPENREERVLFYQGFDIIIPVDNKRENPYLWIQRNGRYYIELGESENGALIRIDNFMQKFPEHLENLENALVNVSAKKHALISELDKKSYFVEKIEELKAELEQIDRELGV